MRLDTAPTPRPSAEGAAREKPIRPKDLFDACRLALEGTEEDRRMFARVMQARYPHVEGLRELNARHRKVTDVLRARSGGEG